MKFLTVGPKYLARTPPIFQPGQDPPIRHKKVQQKTDHKQMRKKIGQLTW